MKKSIDSGRLKRVLKNHSMDDNSAHALFYIYLVVSVDLLKLVSGAKPIFLDAARQNFITNLVTTLEVFCKSLIMQYKGYWNNAGMSDLLQEKITLSESFDLLRESPREEITKELIIIDSYSFSSFHSITFVFCKLTGKKDFNSEIGTNINKKHWQALLMKLFEYRNAIVHDGEEILLKQNQLKDFERVVTEYVESIVSYVHSRYHAKFR